MDFQVGNGDGGHQTFNLVEAVCQSRVCRRSVVIFGLRVNRIRHRLQVCESFIIISLILGTDRDRMELVRAYAGRLRHGIC